jgi:hypothetical protein
MFNSCIENSVPLIGTSMPTLTTVPLPVEFTFGVLILIPPEYFPMEYCEVP